MTYAEAYIQAQKDAAETGFPGCIYYYGAGHFEAFDDGSGELIDQEVPATGPVTPMSTYSANVVAYVDHEFPAIAAE